MPYVQVNAITNPGFETGDFTGWSKDNFYVHTITTEEKHSGTYSLKMEVHF
jgi:hypothetical protein